MVAHTPLRMTNRSVAPDGSGKSRPPFIAAMTTTISDVSPHAAHLHAGPSPFPANPSFAGHQTFAVRSGWLKKGLDALIEDGSIFNRPDALVTLGVGKNMVASIRHWLLATGIADIEGRELKATAPGKRIFSDSGAGFAS